jgi:hypothetical protein
MHRRVFDRWQFEVRVDFAIDQLHFNVVGFLFTAFGLLQDFRVNLKPFFFTELLVNLHEIAIVAAFRL